LVGVVDSIAGDSTHFTIVREVGLGDEHDVYVAQRKQYFQFCVVVWAVGVPECKQTLLYLGTTFMHM
jgi:hypothetical protein